MARYQPFDDSIEEGDQIPANREKKPAPGTPFAQFNGVAGQVFDARSGDTRFTGKPAIAGGNKDELEDPGQEFRVDEITGPRYLFNGELAYGEKNGYLTAQFKSEEAKFQAYFTCYATETIQNVIVFLPTVVYHTITSGNGNPEESSRQPFDWDGSPKSFEASFFPSDTQFAEGYNCPDLLGLYGAPSLSVTARVTMIPHPSFPDNMALANTTFEISYSWRGGGGSTNATTFDAANYDITPRCDGDRIQVATYVAGSVQFIIQAPG